VAVIAFPATSTTMPAVNAVAVKNSALSAGDEIQIGKYHLTLFVGEK
jgi:hypothetical protein